MGNRDDVASSDTAKAMLALLRSRGYDTHDFEIVESPFSDFDDLLGLSDGVVTVRRKSTGEERLYTTGATWLATLLADLALGHFGRSTCDAAATNPAIS